MAIIRVPEDHAVIGNAVAAAAPGDTIIISAAYAGLDYGYVFRDNLTFDVADGIDNLALIMTESLTYGSNAYSITVTGTGNVEIQAWNGFTRAIAGTIHGNDGDNLITQQSYRRNEASGDDYMYGHAGDDEIYGWGGEDTLFGGTGNDVLYGDDPAGTLPPEPSGPYQRTNADILYGDEGNDVLFGGLGNDSLYGGSENDTLTGGGDNDLLDGGSGVDAANFAGAGAAVTVTLTNIVAGHSGGSASGGAGDDLLVDIETIIGSAFNDVLAGNDEKNTLEGGDGNDTLNGGAGIDWVSYQGATGSVEVVIENAGNGHTSGHASGAAGNDILFDIENIRGSNFSDTLTGTDFANSIEGGAGNDTINGDSITALIGSSDLIRGGDGNDWLNGGGGDDTIFGDAGNDIIYGGGDGMHSAGHDGLYGGDGDDTIFGGDFTNTIDGGAGNDRLMGSSTGRIYTDSDKELYFDNIYGGVGDDILIGFFGDRLYGGLGNDRFEGAEAIVSYILSQGPVFVSLNNGQSGHSGGFSSGEEGDDSFLDTRIIEGSNFSDELSGNSFSNYLYGGLSDDDLFGEAGDDYLYGNEDNDHLIGGAGLDRLYGGHGNDKLDGSVGGDYLIGEGGDDTYILDESGDAVIEVEGEGNDTVVSALSYVLNFNVENVTLTGISDLFAVGNDNANIIVGNAGHNNLSGLSGNDLIEGGAGNDTISGDYGDDILIGGGGDDVLRGGFGNDILYGIYSDITGSAIAAYDNVYFGVTVTLTDLVNGQTGGFSTGGGGNDTLFNIQNIRGTIYDDVIHGNAENNILEGLLGLDFIDGDGGFDTASYELLDKGMNIFLYDPSNGHTGGFATGKNSLSLPLANVQHTFRDIEAVIGSRYEDSITGNILLNVLNGGGGNDVIDGGGGGDYLIGGEGDDLYIIRHAGDVVIEESTSGHDEVQSDRTYALGANIEDLTFTGASSINGYGNALVNVIRGNDGDNLLDGGGDADTLIGGKGNDVYVLSVIGDVVLEDSNGGLDEVRIALSYSLGLDVENLTLLGLANVNGFGTGDRNFIVGNSGNNSLYGYAGNDTLDGGNGADILEGGNNNDTLLGGAGADVLRGGAGIDSFDGGAGDDMLYIEQADGAVEGGAGYDIAIFEGSVSNLDSYNMADHGIEELRWAAGGINYLRTITSGVVVEPGPDRRVELFTDAAGAAWAAIRLAYDSANRLDFTDTLYDDNSRVVRDEDEARIANWSSITTTYTSGGGVDYQDYQYDDDSRVIYDGDQGNAANWISIVTTYAPDGSVDYQDYQYDDGSRWIFDYDQKQEAPWGTRSTTYDTNGALNFQDTAYDDGTRVVYDIDNGDVSAYWDIWEDFYDAGRTLVTQRLTLDSGQVVVFNL